MDLGHLRKEYTKHGLHKEDLEAGPIEQFQKWFNLAHEISTHEANAMTLATVDAEGQPSSRIVLLKAVTAAGFTFYTNYESRKGSELAGNPKAALSFHWHSLERQVCIRGVVSKLPRQDAETYFATRPLGSRLSTWVSKQSSHVPSREWMEEKMAEFAAKFGENVPMPPYWGGYVLNPVTVEFWQGRESRLHDRFNYERLPDGAWKVVRLSP